MQSIVEKPGKSSTPSDLASVSSYLLPGSFFGYLDAAAEQYNGEGEFTFQPIMQAMINAGVPFYGVEIKNGTYYDTGNKLEYLKTTIDFGLAHSELGESLRDYLRKKL
jgi:UTP--glucose-1-phosphate uridylyltransferase